MYNIIKYSISIISFIGILLSLLFLLNTKYNAFSIVLIASIEYISIAILNFFFINKKEYLKENIQSLFIIILGSVFTLIILYLVRTSGFSIFYLTGVVWLVFLEIYDRKNYKKNNPIKG